MAIFIREIGSTRIGKDRENLASLAPMNLMMGYG